MPEPSLNEITSIAADPERGTGQPAVIYDNREALRGLNDAAQFKAENDWKKYNLFLKNVGEQYKDLGAIMAQPVMDQDRPELKRQMGDIMASIAKNPKDFFGGGEKNAEVQMKIGKLQSDAAESKQNGIFDFAHRQYLYRNPNLDTPENKASIENFTKQKLGTRQPYQLNLPGLYDPNKMADELNKAAKKEETFSNVTPDNQFIESGTKITYDPDKYGKIAETMYYQPDERGIPIKQTWEKRFNEYPEYIKEQYKKIDPKDPAKAAYIDDLKNRIQGNVIQGYKKIANANFDSPLEKYRAETGRISANASALRASKYAELSNKKLADMDADEKQTKGFWDGIVGNIKSFNLVQEKKGKAIDGDYIFSGDVPAGYKYMGGVDANGKPIKLEPFKSPDGTEYYKTQYTFSKDGTKVDKPFLIKKYRESVANKFHGTYEDYVRQLAKGGTIDIEVLGQTKQIVKDEKGKSVESYSPAVANIETALQAAKALNNKNNSKGDEPVYQTEEIPQDEE